jgi:SAM-dependent methyltransferase
VSPSNLDERVSDYFSKGGTVSQWWTPDSGPLAFHYAAEIQVLAEQLTIDSSWRVLDVGTGAGRFGAFFAERGCRVTGVDLNPDMLEMARETARQRQLEGRFEVMQGSAEDLSQFGDGEFDVVLCMELFDHLPDLGRALSEMRRKLKVAGRFVFTYVPSESIYGALGNVYRWFRTRLTPADLLISRTYSLREVRSQLSHRGLRLDAYWGVGLLCVNAQTRLLGDNAVVRGLAAVARAEASRWPYYRASSLARHGAHVVGLAGAVETDAS